MRLVQLIHPDRGRKVALVQEPKLQLIEGYVSVYDMAKAAIEKKVKLGDLVQKNGSSEHLDYEDIYIGKSDWKLLPSFDHPTDVAKCMLAGTGLTHKASAENRQKMHAAASEEELTDSMKIYLWGVEGGHPKKDEIGVQPEWFYKGNGSILKAHDDILETPCYGDDGGEEPEIAGVYVTDANGMPWRVGFTVANEFSDHVMERKNYLYLAPSKIRNCAIGPELVLTDAFEELTGTVSVARNGKTLWQQDIKTGQKNMCHSLANLEYHHFKYANHCVPGLAHIHFFGADAFSFGEGVSLRDGDQMQVFWKGMGRPLKNTLSIVQEKEKGISIRSLV